MISFAELKYLQKQHRTIRKYTHLKISDEDKVYSYLSSSPRAEFEREIKDERNKILHQDMMEI